MDHYEHKLHPMMKVRDRQVRCRRDGSLAERRREEGAVLLDAVPGDAWVVALDAAGKQHSSEAFAKRLEELETSWPHAVVFVIGSDAGLDETVLERADEVLSLGPMTLPHELARLVLYEQIYRAATIRNGLNYHR
ncbi:MAG: 23S rRNA (pseudouridine(1915)-N(3))-methyltransferase RlmH [Thermoanaerobaculia bacterium]|nr:23S rRNA (pseudouridine(1915)-N(3))-methyltransferase RlmH [Thermoanaerobaculia bacterium]